MKSNIKKLQSWKIELKIKLILNQSNVKRWNKKNQFKEFAKVNSTKNNRWKELR